MNEPNELLEREAVAGQNDRIDADLHVATGGTAGATGFPKRSVFGGALSIGGATGTTKTSYASQTKIIPTH